MVTVRPEDSVEHAAQLMHFLHVKRLPVVDGHGSLVGLVSRADVLAVDDRPDEDIREEITGNVILSDLLKQLVARASLVVSLYENPNGLSCWHGDHANMLKLLRAHKARPAMGLMQRHLDDLEESLVFVPQTDEAPNLRTIFHGGA